VEQGKGKKKQKTKKRAPMLNIIKSSRETGLYAITKPFFGYGIGGV